MKSKKAVLTAVVLSLSGALPNLAQAQILESAPSSTSRSHDIGARPFMGQQSQDSSKYSSSQNSDDDIPQELKKDIDSSDDESSAAGSDSGSVYSVDESFDYEEQSPLIVAREKQEKFHSTHTDRVNALVRNRAAAFQPLVSDIAPNRDFSNKVLDSFRKFSKDGKKDFDAITQAYLGELAELKKNEDALNDSLMLQDEENKEAKLDMNRAQRAVFAIKNAMTRKKENDRNLEAAIKKNKKKLAQLGKLLASFEREPQNSLTVIGERKNALAHSLEVAQQLDRSKSEIKKIKIDISETSKEERKLAKALEQFNVITEVLNGRFEAQQPGRYEGSGALNFLRNCGVKAKTAVKNTFAQVFKLRNKSEAKMNTFEKLTPLMVAIKAGYGRTLVDYEAKEYTRDNPILQLAESTRFLNDKDGLGRTAVHHAVLENDTDTLSFLLLGKDGKKAKANSTDHAGNTPMHLISMPVHVRMLLNAGADLNCQNKQGETPLHTAVKAGNLPLVKELIAKGAKIGIKSKKGIDSQGKKLKAMNALNLAESLLFMESTPESKADRARIHSALDDATVKAEHDAKWSTKAKKLRKAMSAKSSAIASKAQGLLREVKRVPSRISGAVKNHSQIRQRTNNQRNHLI